MNYYRLLSLQEIATLEANGCSSADWQSVQVAEDFTPRHIHGVRFYGDIRLGVFCDDVEVSPGFSVHSGLRNASLNNVTIGNNCLVENVSGHISYYEIGDGCVVRNVGTIETTEGATYGEAGIIPVMNEAGSGNIIICHDLNGNMAALMMRVSSDKEAFARLKRIFKDHAAHWMPECGYVGNGAKIVNTTEITNTIIGPGCEVSGASRLSDCSVLGTGEAASRVGSGVICDNTIIAGASTVADGAMLSSCFVGEASCITKGFSAENSVFFANTYMANGEACAAFCGPFSASHHKSTLLIGCNVEFYNAGSATNFSNHAYKMGPLHHGTLMRGTKTASGAHILLPATIGAFSMCMGKITCHPDTSCMPFSYVIADGCDTWLVPGRNLVTAGLYRDVNKWPRRDMRPADGKVSHVNTSWLNPMVVDAVLEGRRVLQEALEGCIDMASDIEIYGCKIKYKAAVKGLEYYDMALLLFINEVMDSHTWEVPQGVDGSGPWEELSGLVLPTAVADAIAAGIDGDEPHTADSLMASLNGAGQMYGQYLWTYAYKLITRRLDTTCPPVEQMDLLKEQCEQARTQWLAAIRSDALREYALGDVDRDVLDKFMASLKY